MPSRGLRSPTGVSHGNGILSSTLTSELLVIMITYLHHTDPIMPHYRGKEWNFQRGAAATVDRPFLGWQGRFFLHDVAHYHVIHHVRLSFLFPWRTKPNKTNSSSLRCLSVSHLFAVILRNPHPSLCRPRPRSYSTFKSFHWRSLCLFGRSSLQGPLGKLQQVPVCRGRR